MTADVTGTGESTGDIFIVLTLEQLGQKVTGSVLKPKYFSGAIDGAVSGDEFKLHKKNATFEAKLTVSGDEMSGTLRAVSYNAGPGYNRGVLVHFRNASPHSRARIPKIRDAQPWSPRLLLVALVSR